MKCLGIWIALALMLVHSPTALAADWSADREIHCGENLPGCQMVQMVMMGMFDVQEPWEAVTERVLAAAWSRLMEVTEEDLVHLATNLERTLIRRGNAGTVRWLPACRPTSIRMSGKPRNEKYWPCFWTGRRPQKPGKRARRFDGI